MMDKSTNLFGVVLSNLRTIVRTNQPSRCSLDPHDAFDWTGSSAESVSPFGTVRFPSKDPLERESERETQYSLQREKLWLPLLYSTDHWRSVQDGIRSHDEPTSWNANWNRLGNKVVIRPIVSKTCRRHRTFASLTINIPRNARSSLLPTVRVVSTSCTADHSKRYCTSNDCKQDLFHVSRFRDLVQTVNDNLLSNAHAAVLQHGVGQIELQGPQRLERRNINCDLALVQLINGRCVHNLLDLVLELFAWLDLHQLVEVLHEDGTDLLGVWFDHLFFARIVRFGVLRMSCAAILISSRSRLASSARVASKADPTRQQL